VIWMKGEEESVRYFARFTASTMPGFPRLTTSRSGMASCNAGERRPPGTICISGLAGLRRRF
jgi:hypothetical protein